MCKMALEVVYSAESNAFAVKSRFCIICFRIYEDSSESVRLYDYDEKINNTFSMRSIRKIRKVHQILKNKDHVLDLST